MTYLGWSIASTGGVLMDPAFYLAFLQQGKGFRDCGKLYLGRKMCFGSDRIVIPDVKQLAI